MDIAAWLRDLGLEQYAQAFRENAIDAAVLPELTADDLNDLGVNLVGHRRRLLGAIAASPRRHPRPFLRSDRQRNLPRPGRYKADISRDRRR